MATTLEDVEFLEIDGSFIMMPEDPYYESVFWAKNVKSVGQGYYADGVLFRISDDEIDFTYTIHDDWFRRNDYGMTWLDDNKYKRLYQQSMIAMVFDAERI